MLTNNATPGHCVICGTQNRRNLCATCRSQYLNEDGSLPDWLRELQNEQKRRHDRERYNAQVVRRGPVPKNTTGKGGRPQNYGVTFVSLEHMQDQGIEV